MTDVEELLKDKRVLVVDDEKFSRGIVVRFLHELCCQEPVQAQNGAEGLAALIDPSYAFDAVVCDFNMPAVNGLQLLKAIRTGFNGVRNDLPVVMLTGHSDHQLVGAALALDVDAFIVKPVSRTALLTRMQHALATPRMVKSPEDCATVDVDAVSDQLRAAPEPAKRPAEPEAPTTPRRGHEVALDALVPPAILAQDVHAASGELLLAAGTTLSPRLVERLKELTALGIRLPSIWVED